MIILGDVHGDIGCCRKVCQNFPEEDVLQLGDFGVGFFDEEDRKEAKALPKSFHFFCGNHDDREAAKEYPSYVGDFGTFKDVFFVCGADSIDKNWRIEGLSWWRHEELSSEEGKKVLSLWEKSDKEILVTHDCPQFFAEDFLRIYGRSSTRVLLDEMYKIRRPKVHVFGHHHKSIRLQENGTMFRCLKKGESFKV